MDSQKMNALIWLDAIAGISLLSFTLWLALVVKEWLREEVKY